MERRVDDLSHASADTPDVAAVAAFVADRLDASRFAPAEAGVVRPSAHPIARLGLAIEAWPGLVDWTRASALDAIFLHRPWALDAAALPPHVGVLFAHLPFDERLTVGWNAPLATALGMRGASWFGEHAGRLRGMLGDIDPTSSDAAIARVVHAFGGADTVVTGAVEVASRIAVVGAMTDALVREAAARGAALYVTGQWRAGGERAVREIGIALVAVGHARAERWGLGALRAMIRERWPAMHVELAEEAGSEA